MFRGERALATWNGSLRFGCLHCPSVGRGLHLSLYMNGKHAISLNSIKKLFTLLSELRKSAVCTLILLTAIPALAQHPYLWLDSTELAFMRNKVASNSSDLQGLEAQCDTVAGESGPPYTVNYSSGNPAGNAMPRRDYFSS